MTLKDFCKRFFIYRKNVDWHRKRTGLAGYPQAGFPRGSRRMDNRLSGQYIQIAAIPAGDKVTAVAWFEIRLEFSDNFHRRSKF